MPKRHTFAAKGYQENDIEKAVKSFEISPSYVEIKPIRGITEIQDLLEIASQNNSWISGGYARYCVSQAERPLLPGDIDIFSVNNVAHKRAIKAFKDRYSPDDFYTIDQDGEEVVVEDIDEDADNFDTTAVKGESETEFAVSFKMNPKEYPEFSHVGKIQFIKPSDKRKVNGNICDIMDGFDFTICKVALVSPHVAICHMGLQNDEISRTLRIQGDILNPLSAFTRSIKYAKKGYHLAPHSMLKILNAWHLIEDKSKLDHLAELIGFYGKMDESSEIDKEIDFYEMSKILMQHQDLYSKVEPEKWARDFMSHRDEKRTDKNMYDEFDQNKRKGNVVLEINKKGYLMKKKNLCDYPF